MSISPGHFLFDIHEALEIAKPIIEQLKHHVKDDEVDVYRILSVWFSERLEAMCLAVVDIDYNRHMPLNARVFIDSLPAEIRAMVDTALYYKVKHLWKPGIQVSCSIQYDTLQISC